MALFELGSKVRDKITGVEGIAIARTDWLYGCVRYVVQPQALHEGKPVESQQFDEGQLELVQPEVVNVQRKDTGGPAVMPVRNSVTR